MSILDYHGKNLLPAVWHPDGDVTNYFAAQLDQQLERFPEVSGVLLVGDATSHYWANNSDVDVILLTPKEYKNRYRREAELASGYSLAETDNRIRFYVVANYIHPDVIAKRFGPVYNIGTGVWHGKLIRDEMEFVRPDAIIQYINWRLYRAKNNEDLFPVDWRVLREAFSELTEDSQEEVLDELRYRIADLDSKVSNLLTRHPKEIWRQAETFEKELNETEKVPDTSRIPLRLALSILHRFRYADILYTLEDYHNRVVEQRERYEQYEKRSASFDNDDLSSQDKTLIRRLDQLVTLLIQRKGGYAKAIDTVSNLFEHILDDNRYVATDLRKQRVAWRLYMKYYRRQRVK